MFSESWHHVSALHISLLPTVRVHKQFFRGEAWYVLRDAFNNRFYKVRPEAYHFVVRLNAKKSVEEVWNECLTLYPDSAPGQEEVVRLLSQLHTSNLLYFKNRPDNQHIFERYSKGKRKEMQNKLLSFLFIRIPLWDPDAWLNRITPVIHYLFSAKGLVLWLIALLFGAQAVVENFSALTDQAQGMLAPDNLILVYVGMLILKVLHEFGHAMVCKAYGGTVHTLGVMLLIFTPLPYMDATASWGFRNRWHRAMVGAAGMLVELFFAALAAVVWAHSGDGVVHSLAFNMMIIGSVSSLMFNGNPLLRFDSYYILSDVLEIPNLYQRARDQWYYWVEKFIFGLDQIYPPGQGLKETFWLALYGIASFGYRILISVGILLFVADQWFALGAVIFVAGVYMLLLKPLYQFLIYLTTNAKLYRHRKRAIISSALMMALLAGFIGFLPFPDSVRAQGVVQANPFVVVYAASEGTLNQIHVRSGQRVEQGDLLLTLDNAELAIKTKTIQAQIKEVKALHDRALQGNLTDIRAIEARMALLKEKLSRLDEQQEGLLVRAEVAGIWVSPSLEQRLGTWFQHRADLGTIVSAEQLRFTAIVSQEEAAELFDQQIPNQGVKFWGRAGTTFAVSGLHVIPYERDELPSAALGWFGGGNIAVSSQGKDGKRAKESFFEVRADLIVDARNDMALLHGRTGVLHIDLPPRPIAVQLKNSLSQLLQKRYQL